VTKTGAWVVIVHYYKKNVNKSAKRTFLYDKKRVSLRYVFAVCTYKPSRAAAASQEVAAADVGGRVQIKGHYTGV
jgi:hypothetical protein